MKNKFRTDVEAFHILQLYCKPEYRGIGLSKALLEAFCSSALSAPGNRVTIELLGTALDLAEFLENTGFRAFSQVLEVDAPTWKEIHQSVEPM